MLKLLIPAAIILGPILLVALVGLVGRSARFRWANVFKLYLTLLFGFFGAYGHLMHVNHDAPTGGPSTGGTVYRGDSFPEGPGALASRPTTREGMP